MGKVETVIILLLSFGACVAGRPSSQAANEVGIHQYFVELAEKEPTENHKQLSQLTDSSIIHKQMDIEQMSNFMKSTKWQTRMVYAYSKATKIVDGEKVISPYDLVHSLADDLFNRKALQKFVSKRQKDGLLLRRDIIDWALEGQCFSVDFLERLTLDYDRNTFKQEEDDRDVK